MLVGLQAGQAHWHFLSILRTQTSLGYSSDTEFPRGGKRVEIIKMPHVSNQTYYFSLDVTLRVRRINDIKQVFVEHLLMSLALHADCMENKKTLRYRFKLNGFLPNCGGYAHMRRSLSSVGKL